MLIHKFHAVPMLFLCYAFVALCRGLEKSLSERHDVDATGARHERGLGAAWHV
jgi:hypothetical protein